MILNNFSCNNVFMTYPGSYGIFVSSFDRVMVLMNLFILFILPLCMGI